MAVPRTHLSLLGDGDEHHEQVGYALSGDSRGGHEGDRVGDVVVGPVQLRVQAWVGKWVGGWVVEWVGKNDRRKKKKGLKNVAR